MDFAIFFDIFSCDANDSLSIFQLQLKSLIYVKIDTDRECVSFILKMQKGVLALYFEWNNLRHVFCVLSVQLVRLLCCSRL